MRLSGFWIVFAFGVFGAALGELYKWYGLRESSNLPRYARSVFYWTVTGGIVVAGGLLASAYGHDSVNAIEKIQVGLATPLSIKALASVGVQRAKGTRGPGRGLPAPGSGAGMLEFLSGGYGKP